MLKSLVIVVILAGFVFSEDGSTPTAIDSVESVSNSATTESISRDLKNTELDLQILQGINKMEKELIDEALSASGRISASELLEAQMRMTEFTIRMELMSKTVSAMDKNIESLLKSQ
ncbi:uncharacterized protein LOC120326243 [Styela clava]